MTTTARKAAPRKAAPRKRVAPNGNGGGEAYEPPAVIRPPAEHKVREGTAPVVEHPLYGLRKVFSYQPKNPDYIHPRTKMRVGSDPIELPDISTCEPDALFFYRNRNKNEMYQAFAWMDEAGIPDEVGERVFSLPPGEQAEVMTGWFAGLNLTPQRGVAPPGEL